MNTLLHPAMDTDTYVPAVGDRVIYKKSLDSGKNLGREQQCIPARVLTVFQHLASATIQPLTPGVARKVVKLKHLEPLSD